MDRSPLPPSCAARFAWERVLASGGFGAVHLCTQAHLGRKVVVKLLHGDALQDAEQVARFLDEARMAASIEHPNVVRVIDSDAGDVPWIAYEYVPGQNLRQLLGAGCVTLVPEACSRTRVQRSMDDNYSSRNNSERSGPGSQARPGRTRPTAVRSFLLALA